MLDAYEKSFVIKLEFYVQTTVGVCRYGSERSFRALINIKLQSPGV